jgi:Xaa-Pro dipeptidase
MLTDERNLRTGKAITEAGADWAILTSPDSVCYATGHEVPIEAGPSPFAGGPSCAVIAPDGTAALVVANVEEAAARASRAAVVRAYEGFGHRRQAPVVDNFAGALRGLLGDLGVSGTIAVEPTSFPASIGEIAGDQAEVYVDIDPFLRRHRATKTAAELDTLRACAALTGAGQTAALQAARAGRSELEIFADIRCAMERQAGVRLPVTGDLLSGAERTAAFTGWPVERIVRDGEPVIADLAPRFRGYWGDSCNTIHLGQPPAAFMRLYRTVQRALEQGIEQLRPGITAGEFDAAVRGVVEREGLYYPHHTGHGIGTSVHEYPRLVPEETATLEAGMVLLVEPGAYEPGVGGVRLEWMFLVTPHGNEVLSPFEHRMSP